jgi:Xaa-Pro aminopeptidase
MLNPTLCRERQKRLAQVMAEMKLEAVVIGNPSQVYYFTGHLAHFLHQSAFVLFESGDSMAWTANKPLEAAADKVEPYEANRMSTLRLDQPGEVATKILAELRGRSIKSVGVDISPVTAHIGLRFDGQRQSLEGPIWQMRRPKDADELELIQKAIRCSEKMYARAKEIIEPGIPELRVYNELHAAAVNEAGEPMSARLGNDYTCGGGGGPPRNGRLAQDGEIYILDLGPAYRGYFADNCRAFAVNRKPTEPQLKAQQAIVGALGVVEKMARPGVKCRDIFNAASNHLKAAFGQGLTHHLGHGIGLNPHEFPHLNPKWDDTLIEGEVFAAEPGLYAPELGTGIRLENNYLVTKDGVRNLLNFPLDLA